MWGFWAKDRLFSVLSSLIEAQVRTLGLKGSYLPGLWARCFCKPRMTANCGTSSKGVFTPLAHRRIYEQSRAAPEGTQKRAVITQTQIPREPDNLNRHGPQGHKHFMSRQSAGRGERLATLRGEFFINISPLTIRRLESGGGQYRGS